MSTLLLNESSDSSTHNKPVIVYFHQDWQEHLTPEMLSLLNDESVPFRTEFCESWKDLSSVLNQAPTQIVFHIDMVTQDDSTVVEFMSMLETLIKFTTHGSTISVGVAIDPDTPYSVIKDLKRTSLIGIVPSPCKFGFSEMLIGARMLIARTPYWPRHIIEQLPGAVIKTSHCKDEIKLTNRQTEIFNLVCKRGLSNKKIAQILNISESTVKVHISAILKSYKVRNRTQLALSGTEQGLRA